MPIDNLGRKHILPAQMATIDAALNAIEAELKAITQNLSNEERTFYGFIREKNKLLANATQDWAQTQPTLKSTEVAWLEFEADYTDRHFADSRLHRFATLQRMLSDFKIVHDYDNYQDALIDYKHAQYKASTNTPGFTEKVAYMRQFFPATGNRKKSG